MDRLYRGIHPQSEISAFYTHARISMDGKETLETRLHGKDSVVLDVWY